MAYHFAYNRKAFRPKLNTEIKLSPSLAKRMYKKMRWIQFRVNMEERVLHTFEWQKLIPPRQQFENAMDRIVRTNSNDEMLPSWRAIAEYALRQRSHSLGTT